MIGLTRLQAKQKGRLTSAQAAQREKQQQRAMKKKKKKKKDPFKFSAGRRVLTREIRSKVRERE